MRPLAHLTPRYVLARLREAAYRRRHPNDPWLTRAAIGAIESRLAPGQLGLELGSGRSTVWLARRLGHLTSVEHDPVWYGRTRDLLDRAGASNADLHLCEGEEDDPRGGASPYVQLVRELADDSLDIVIVDGILRDHCTLASLPKLRPGGMLVVDNANWYLPCDSRAPGSLAPNAGPASPLWDEFLRRVDGWERRWTTNGVFDTALWTRPGKAPA